MTVMPKEFQNRAQEATGQVLNCSSQGFVSLRDLPIALAIRYNLYHTCLVLMEREPTPPGMADGGPRTRCRNQEEVIRLAKTKLGGRKKNHRHEDWTQKKRRDTPGTYG